MVLQKLVKSYKLLLLFSLFHDNVSNNTKKTKPKKILFTPTDAYGIFIDNGNLDSYLSSDVNNIDNDTYFNGTFNLSRTAISNATNTADEDVAELIIMAVTSTLLGLMILITIIGNI